MSKRIRHFKRPYSSVLTNYFVTQRGIKSIKEHPDVSIILTNLSNCSFFGSIKFLEKKVDNGM